MRPVPPGPTWALAVLCALIGAAAIVQAQTKPRNLLLLLSDQQHTFQWAPPDWEAKNLPNIARLRKNGMSFVKAKTAGNMCSPSRATIFTGKYISQHKSTWTLTSQNYQSHYEVQLRPELPNLATILKAAGYDVVYKGKWHLSKGYVNFTTGAYAPDDISRYGFDEWDKEGPLGMRGLDGLGGGFANNDGRATNDAIGWLKDRIAKQTPSSKPFALIVSLINPHDIPVVYPGSITTPAKYVQGGYDDTWLRPTTPPLPLPPTYDEKPGVLDLASIRVAYNANTTIKPYNEWIYRFSSEMGLGPLNTTELKQNYINMYANAAKAVDGLFDQIYQTFLTTPGGDKILNDTLIVRTADHGEMGMAHGGQRQKPFMPYNEALKIPMIFSNPVLFPTAAVSDALITTVDLIPSFCEIFSVDCSPYGLSGVSFAKTFTDSKAKPRGYQYFEFEDIWATFGESNPPLLNQIATYFAGRPLEIIKNISNGVLPGPSRLRVIHDGEFTFALNYDDQVHPVDPQASCYDERPEGGDYSSQYGQPLQLRNLSPWAEKIRASIGLPTIATKSQAVRCEALKKQLTKVAQRIPVPTFPVVAAEGVKVRFFKNLFLCPELSAEVFFISRHLQSYYLYQSAAPKSVGTASSSFIFSSDENGYGVPKGWTPVYSVNAGSVASFPDGIVQGNSGPIYLIACVSSNTSSIAIATFPNDGTFPPRPSSAQLPAINPAKSTTTDVSATTMSADAQLSRRDGPKTADAAEAPRSVVYVPGQTCNADTQAVWGSDFGKQIVC